MSVPDFTRAEYMEPQVIEGEVVGAPAYRQSQGRFGLALAYGAGAALVGSVGYALIGLSGFMVSIVAIGMAWLIAKAMLTASGGLGGRQYQVAAVLLTYFSVTLGELLHPMYTAHLRGIPLSHMFNGWTLMYLLFGPFLALMDGLNGILGLVILAIGLRAAWQMTAGGPGRRGGPFGLR